ASTSDVHAPQVVPPIVNGTPPDTSNIHRQAAIMQIYDDLPSSNLPPQLATTSVTHPAAQSVASTVTQSVAPDTIAPTSVITLALIPSQPAIHVPSDYTDPLAHDMSQRPHDPRALDTVVDSYLALHLAALVSLSLAIPS
ncbi:Hypothetical predicted protein, partial [Olea europaea subsp. europaea]